MKPITKWLYAIALVAAFATLTSCKNLPVSYTVDGSGRDWIAKPVQTLPASKVTPKLGVPLPDVLGGGSVSVPIKIPNQK